MSHLHIFMNYWMYWCWFEHILLHDLSAKGLGTSSEKLILDVYLTQLVATLHASCIYSSHFLFLAHAFLKQLHKYMYMYISILYKPSISTKINGMQGICIDRRVSKYVLEIKASSSFISNFHLNDMSLIERYF